MSVLTCFRRRSLLLTVVERLEISYLYRYVTFPREGLLHRFAARLAAAPAVSAHVHEMQMDSYRFERNDGSPAVDLASPFRSTPRLRRLLGDEETRLPWAAVTSEEISGFESHETKAMRMPESPAVFAPFTILRCLTWDSGYRPLLTAFFFDRKAAVLKDGPRLAGMGALLRGTGSLVLPRVARGPRFVARVADDRVSGLCTCRKDPDPTLPPL